MLGITAMGSVVKNQLYGWYSKSVLRSSKNSAWTTTDLNKFYSFQSTKTKTTPNVDLF